MLAMGVFMCPLAYYAVRRPFIMSPLEPILTQPGWDLGIWLIFRDALRLCYAPLTEEPAKLLPWIVLLTARAPLVPTWRMIAPLALSAGLGFALGEIWVVAWLVTQANDAKLAALPWYAFGGFLTERLMTCLTHALFALPTMVLSRKGCRWGFVGLAIGMALHWVGNAPIMLMHYRPFGWTRETWAAIIQLWIVAIAMAGLVSLIGIAAGRQMLQRIWSHQIVCPGCGEIYRQSIVFGLNCGLYRYERCGVCRKWHWVTLKDLAPVKPPQAVR